MTVPWYYIPWLGQWGTGDAYYGGFQSLVKRLKESKNFSTPGGNLHAVQLGDYGWVWSENVWLRYSWRSSWFRPGYMEVQWAKDANGPWYPL